MDWAYRTGRVSADVYRIVRPSGSAKPSVRVLAAAAAKKAEDARTVAAAAVEPAVPQVRVNAGLNPLVYETVERGLFHAAVAASRGAVPTLFAGGDVPVFTASGVDPDVVLRVPWEARHALAAEPNRERALDMVEMMSGPEGSVMAAEYAGHPGNLDYRARVQQWAMAGMDHSVAQAQRQEWVAASSATAPKTVDEMNDDEIYDAMFGHLDRRAEQRRYEDDLAIVEGRASVHGRDVAQVRASLQARVAAGQYPQGVNRSGV